MHFPGSLPRYRQTKDGPRGGEFPREAGVVRLARRLASVQRPALQAAVLLGEAARVTAEPVPGLLEFWDGRR